MELMLVFAASVALAVLLRPTGVLAANRSLGHFADTEIRAFDVAAAVHIYKDAYVGLNPAGYLKPFVPGDKFAGIAYEESDNMGGAAGDKSCRVATEGDWEMALTGVAISDSGKPVYAVSDEALALTGHPDGFVGMVLHPSDEADKAVVRLRNWGDEAPNGVGSVTLRLNGTEAFAATGAVAATVNVGGFAAKSILGLGVAKVAAEDAGVAGEFDAVAEVALASVRMPDAVMPVDKGITFEADVCLTDKGDAAALDFDVGVGSALTVNSEADVDHADMAQLFAFHMDGNSDNILLQSDNATTDVAPVDTTIDNDSATDVPKRLKGIVRPDGTCEGWIDSGAGFVRMLAATAFAVLNSAVLAFFANAEKTNDDTPTRFLLKNVEVKFGIAAD